MHQENNYLNLIKDILANGTVCENRTGINTKKVFGRMLEFDIQEEFPLLTTKQMFFRGVVEELLWFLRGDTDSKKLEEQGVNIWKDNTSLDFLQNLNLPYPEGEAGPIYGFQWRNYNGSISTSKVIAKDRNGRFCGTRPNAIIKEKNGIDQIANLIDEIKTNPLSRRHLVVAYNPYQLDLMCLPPCHYAFQMNVDVGSKELSCLFHMRSVDVGLGLPFNIASYALLTHIIARCTGLKAKKLIWCGGDVHIYKNHIKALEEQSNRTPNNWPTLDINKQISNIKDIENLLYKDIVLNNYTHQGKIEMSMAV